MEFRPKVGSLINAPKDRCLPIQPGRSMFFAPHVLGFCSEGWSNPQISNHPNSPVPLIVTPPKNEPWFGDEIRYLGTIGMGVDIISHTKKALSATFVWKCCLPRDRRLWWFRSIVPLRTCRHWHNVVTPIEQNHPSQQAFGGASGYSNETPDHIYIYLPQSKSGDGLSIEYHPLFTSHHIFLSDQIEFPDSPGRASLSWTTSVAFASLWLWLVQPLCQATDLRKHRRMRSFRTFGR